MASPAAAPQHPGWVKEFLASFDSAESSAFMMHTGVHDYVVPGVSVSEHLAKLLVSGKFEVVAFYSVSKGITFPTVKDKAGKPITAAAAQMRARFFEIIGQSDSDPNEPILMAPEPAASLLLDLLRKAPDQKAAVIFERLDNMVGDLVPVDASVISLMEMLHDAGTDKALVSHGNPLIMMTPSLEEIRSQVRRNSSGIKTIEIPLPDYEARLAFARQRFGMEDMTELTLDGITLEQLAAITAGLMRRHIENIMLRALKTPSKRMTREIALTAQRELMDVEYAGIVKRIDKPFTLDQVGGHVEAKSYLTKRVVNLMREGKTERVPQGVLLAGPSGTGKTMLATAVANDSGLNCLEVDLAMLMSELVGGTEKNVAKLRQAVVANAPTIAFMDEIDQKVRRGEGGPDSGGGGAVENRLFSAILELVGDVTLKGKVVWVFATNKPKLMDFAFLSRLQAILPILPAVDDEARGEMLSRIVNRMGNRQTTTADVIQFAPMIKDWSGRDVDQAVDEALAVSDIDGVTLSAALEETLTYRRADISSVAEHIKEALDVCKDARLIPERYRAQATATAVKQPESETTSELRKARKVTWGAAD